jgi:hypothetical protein
VTVMLDKARNGFGANSAVEGVDLNAGHVTDPCAVAVIVWVGLLSDPFFVGEFEAFRRNAFGVAGVPLRAFVINSPNRRPLM